MTPTTPWTSGACKDGGRKGRRIGIVLLSLFFLCGAVIAFVSMMSLLFPGGWLEPMWRLNPRARLGFARMGSWSVVLMAAVSAACAFSAYGLWRGTRWGHALAVGMLSVNLVADVLNVILARDFRAAAGIPIASALIAYMMSARVRSSIGGRR